MITWDSMPYFSAISFVFALIAVLAACRASCAKHNEKSARRFIKVVNVAMFASVLAFLAFIIGLWVSLERPPFKTMGETRLWYSLFLLFIGWMTWTRTRYAGVLALSIVMSVIFMVINIVRPEIHAKELMPVLDSLWFVPHVIVYMFAYALIGCACLIVINEAVFHRWKPNLNALHHCDMLVWYGLALLTMGMIMGALWAKQAWGDYWSWDPKETWAAITWLTGLIYIHLRLRKGVKQQVAYALVLILFLLFQVCWYGINYLPAAQNSVHTYN